MTETEQVQAFIQAARRCFGMRFVSGAKGQAGAIDCVHVPLAAAKAIGYLPAEYTIPRYPLTPDPSIWDGFIEIADEVTDVRPETVRAGDIVILYEHLAPGSQDTAYPRHCGILVPAIPGPGGDDGSVGGWHWFGVNFANPSAFVTELPFHKKLWNRIYKVYRLRPPVNGS